MNIRDTLRRHVYDHGLGVIARRSGVDASHLSRWLRGQSGMHIDKVERVARACGLRLQLTERRRR